MMSFLNAPGSAWVLLTLLVALFFLLLVIVVLLYALYARQKGFDAAFSRTIGEEREKTLSHLANSFDSLRRDVRDSSNELKTSQASQMTAFMGLMQKASELQNQSEKDMQDSLLKQLESQSLRQEKRLELLTGGISTGLDGMRQSLNEQLTGIRESNDRALMQMRTTVEDKLQQTLNERISESFQKVDEQLKSVYNGLGEMRQVAQNVDGLRRVLVNVKTRGTFGEVQLGNLLSEILTPDQYDTNVATIPGSGERVEFAVKLPGKEDGRSVYLPIDAKFPLEDYERLVEAAEAADSEQVEASAKALEVRILAEAEKIHRKYVQVPYTTEFAILYLPIESLWAEVIKRPGLIERVHRISHVTIAGPTVLAALLNSLQLGFRTLAIEKKSEEVSIVLGKVKSEFLKFSEAFDAVDRKVDGVRTALENVRKRTNIMSKNLRDVETVSIAAPEGAAALEAPAKAPETPNN